MVVKFPKFTNVAQQGNVQRIPPTHTPNQLQADGASGPTGTAHSLSHTQQHKHSTQGGISSQGTQPSLLIYC